MLRRITTPAALQAAGGWRLVVGGWRGDFTASIFGQNDDKNIVGAKMDVGRAWLDFLKTLNGHAAQPQALELQYHRNAKLSQLQRQNEQLRARLTLQTSSKEQESILKKKEMELAWHEATLVQKLELEKWLVPAYTTLRKQL